jgi:murein L,D-transpeptidase YcbB/YkuD
MQGQDGIDAARIAELARTNERLDSTVANPPQLRVAYLTAWPAKGGVAAFRPDVYELDGTGFVVGQPLPVGEKLNGQRYVLKPIPRLQQDIDTNDGFGFASLFRRNGDRNDVARPGQSRKNSDSLISLPSSKAKKDAEREKAEKAKLAKKKADEKARLAKKKADEKARLAKKKADEKAKLAKKKADEKARLAKAEAKDAKSKKVVKKDSATAAAKKPDQKAKAPAKKASDCKPGSDGKLPAGCTAAAPKKPAAKPEKTAAKSEKTAAAAN